MTNDRAKIETTSKQLLLLNQEIESVVSDRTKAEMALNLAHEIRNPVMIISGLFKRLRRTAADESRPDDQYHREIKQQIDQLEALVTRFEDMQDANRDHFQAIELNRLLHDAVAMVRDEAEEKEIEFVFLPSKSSGSCQGDWQYLTAAFLHLFRNGIEACRAGDRIDIIAEAADTGTFVQIKDNGPGIPKHILSHIFEPFYSTRDGATGMGLSYVRQIVNEHRGRINLESTRGQGTKVEVFIPGFLGQLK
jgi:signal transduction histidine kinase